MDISINSLIEGANFSDACCSACHAAGAYRTTVKHSVQFLSPVFKVWYFSGIWEPGLLLMIPAGVVAVGVSWHRACVPCPCRPRGCNRACRVVRGISNTYAWTCAVRGKQSPGSPEMQMQACVYSGMHWPADSKRSYGSAAQSVWLRTDRIRNLMERQYRWTAVPICRFLQTGCVDGLSGVAGLFVVWARRMCGAALACSQTGSVGSPE